jgi:hypothetical protein
MNKVLAILAIGSLPVLASAWIADKKEGTVQFPVFLNHFYLTLDHETYSAIQSNEFLRREFAVTEERTTVRKDRSYTGLYFYGTNTYFEFFDADKEKRRRVGDSAIAFGVEEPGASGKLEAELGSHSVTITRQLGNMDIPWFLQTMPKGFSLESAVSTWVMEYDPRFLLQWHGDEGGGSGITRKEILERYKAVLKRGSAQTCLSDVIGITLGVDKQVSGQMTELCKAFGYDLRAKGDMTILLGPEFELRLVPDTDSARGVRQALLRVNRTPIGHTQVQCGSKSLLKIRPDGTATWAF